MSIEELTTANIERMNYNELIGVTRETNRPPGGRQSIHEVCSAVNLNERKKVLDIGTSTGVTALEFAAMTDAAVTGIDINPTSLLEAKRRAEALGLGNVEFIEADATDLPFEDETFDLVFCGNVTSLIENDSKALEEYIRVSKTGGIIAAIPMYYVETPPVPIVEAVRSAIEVPIAVNFRQDQMTVFLHSDLTEISSSDWRFSDVNEEDVHDFCDHVLGADHLQALDDEARSILEEKYRTYMQLFRSNLSYMGYTVLLLRKSTFQEEPELFVGVRP